MEFLPQDMRCRRVEGGDCGFSGDGDGRALHAVVTQGDIFKPSSPQEEMLARPLGSDAPCPTSAFACSALCCSLG